MLLMDGDEFPRRNGKETPVKPRVAAKAAGVSLTTMRRWRAAGLITALRTRGGQFRYYISEVIAYRERDKAGEHSKARRAEQFNFRCPDALKDDVAQMARDLRRTESAIVRMAVEDAVARHKSNATRKHDASRAGNTKASPEIASPLSALENMLVRAIADLLISDTALRNYANTPERSDVKELLNLFELVRDAKSRDSGGNQ